MEKRQILIVGHKGLIGNHLANFYKKQIDVNLICVDKNKNFDLTNKNQLILFLKKHKNIQYVINASGKNDHIDKDKRKQFENEKILIEYIN